MNSHYLSLFMKLFKSLTLLLCLGFGSTVQADLQFSYSEDLSNAAPVQDAAIEARVVYLFDDAGGASVACCNWVRGPGSRSRGEPLSATLGAGESLQVDLSDYPPGGVFNARLGSGDAKENNVFTITRPSNFDALELQDSGAIVASEDGQIIENLRIDSGKDDDCAITVKGHKDVVIRNVYITHKRVGICLNSAENALIQNAKVVSTSAPKKGPHCKFGVKDCRRNKADRADADDRINIIVNNESHDLIVEHVEMENAFVRSHYSSLKNFYTKNILDVSHDLDIINMYESDFVTISHGLVDGSYGRNAAGAIADKGSDNATIANVDFIRTSGMAVAVASGSGKEGNATVGEDFLAKNIKVSDTSCIARDKKPPSSGGLVVWIKPAADNPVVENLRFHNHCREHAVWCLNPKCRKKNDGKGGKFDIKESKEELILRDPLQLIFDWELEVTDFPSTEEVLEGLK